VRVRQVAHRFQIVLEAVVHRDQRNLDELRFSIDDALEVGEIDASVPRRDDAEVEPLVAELDEVQERALEVQRIGDDVPIEFRDAQAFDDEVLAGARVRDVTDLGRLRVDQRREGVPRVHAARRCAQSHRRRRPDRAAAVHGVAVRVRRRDRHRVRERAADVGDAILEREVGFPRKRIRRLRCPSDGSARVECLRRGEASESGQELTTGDGHGCLR